MAKLKTKIEIEVWDIEVTDDGYFSFDFSVKRDGTTKKGKYDSDYDSQSAKTWRKTLQDGAALDIVIENELF